MDTDVENIYKDNNKTRRTIYEAIGEPYFGEGKIPPKKVFELFKNNPNEPQNIPPYTNKKIESIDL